MEVCEQYRELKTLSIVILHTGHSLTCVVPYRIIALPPLKSRHALFF